MGSHLSMKRTVTIVMPNLSYTFVETNKTKQNKNE
jgi:hypothetical protein